MAQKSRTPRKLLALGLAFWLLQAQGTQAEEGARLTLGEDTYDLDFVICFGEPDGSVRIGLGDEAARAEFPAVSIWVLADQQEGTRPQVHSVEFSLVDPVPKWRMIEGSYALTPEGFTSSGVMQGRARQDGENIDLGELPFSLDVQCNPY